MLTFPFRSFIRLLVPGLALLVAMTLTSCHKKEAASTDSKATDSIPSSVTGTTPAATPAAAPTTTTAPATTAPAAAPSSDELQMIRDAYALDLHGKFDEALAKMNSVIQTNPKSITAYILRGGIYSKKKAFDLSQKDYESVLQIDPNNSTAKFNISELKFMQKDYDGARTGFLALEPASDLGDLAKYKVFLCDLFGGHDDAAKKEFDDFNTVGGNASYYFANVAWFVYHKDTDNARTWLGSAQRIYPPQKFALYASSLHDLGYLPLPPATPAADTSAPPPPASTPTAPPAN